MADIQFRNFATSTLAVGIASGDLTLAVVGGHGARFPTLTGAQYFYATIENASAQREIVKVTARTVDTFTIVRGQDNTTAAAWLAGDSIALRFNAKAIEDSIVNNVLLSGNQTIAGIKTFSSAIVGDLTGNVTGLASNVSGTVAFANGGTGQTTALAARAALEAARGVQPITASVAANALTLTLNPTTLDFRSATLGNGTVNVRTVAAAISLVISNGSTLGTTSAVASRIAVLAIDNAGTVELAAVNLAGGTNLDETGVISTTAEGGAGAADSSTIAYSATARAGVPYRVVGYVESTQATAGTWATAPSLIQGAGGAATSSFQSIGQGQTWQIVTGSRAYSTTYTNTTIRPIAVKVHIAQTVANAITSVEGRVNGVAIDLVQATGSAAGGQNFMIDLLVPPGSTYAVVVINNAGGSTLAQWAELR